MARPWLVSVCVCACVSMGVGCEPPTAKTKAEDKPNPKGSTPASPDPDPPEPAPVSDPAPTPSTSAAGSSSGRAYVNVEHAGVFVIDDAGWHLVYTSREPIRDITTVDGRLVVLTTAGVLEATDIGSTRPLAPLAPDDYKKLGMPAAMAGDGRQLWVSGINAVGHWDTDAWAFETLPAAENQSRSLLGDLAVDGSGRPWIVSGSLLRRDAKTKAWTKLEPVVHARQIVTSSDHASVLAHAGCAGGQCGMVRWVGDAQTHYTVPHPSSCAGYEAIAVSPGGDFALLAGSCGLVRWDLADPAAPSKAIAVDASGWLARTPDAVAIDDRGRVWAGMGYGFVVVATDGSDDEVVTPQRFPLAGLTEIAGLVDRIVVVGDGPPVPALSAARKGGLKGTLVQADAPIANAKVELCDASGREPAAVDPTRSACDGIPGVITTTTDASGVFEVGDLEVGGYTIAVEIDGRWSVGLTRSMNMRTAMTGNVGKVVVPGLD